MRRVARGILVALALGALLLPTARALATTALPAYSTVVIVLAPYLTWTDIDPHMTPALWTLAGESALGSASVRTGALEPAPDALSGAAVLAAGQPVADPDAPVVGVLGAAVLAAGGQTAALGSSAATVDDALRPGSAHAAVVAGDPAGTVTFSETSPRVIRADGGAPSALTTDLDVLEAAYRDALMRRATGEAPLLVVLDPGDPSRARLSGPDPEAWESARARAVRTVDEVTAIAWRSLPDDAALIVVSTAQYAPGAQAGFGPVLLYGGGPGSLYSPATRRDGVLTLPDISRSALAMLGVDAPDAMTGSPLAISGRASESESALALATRADASARALEALRQPVWAGMIGLSVLGLLLTLGVVLLPGGAPHLARRVLAYGLVVTCAVPAGSLLAQVAGYPSGAADAWLRLGCGVAVAVLLSVWRTRGGGPRAALGRVALATVLVAVIDQLLGGPAAYGSAFSYSALFGARFYGLGNEGAAVLAGAALVLVGVRMDRYGYSRAREHLWLGAVVVAVAVAPMLGANTGVAAWGTVAFAAAYLYGAKRRLDAKAALLVLGAVVAIVAVAVLIDVNAAGPSHLGRLLGGGGGLVPMLARKAALSFTILTATPLVVLLPLGIAAIVYLLVRPRGPVGAVVSGARGAASALAGGVAAAVVGMITEDSGVAVAALVMLMPASALAVAALEREEGEA